jgi:transcriptional regulator with XRE-family HTH domain
MADATIFYSRVGKRIRDARRGRGLSQAELATAASLGRTSIANIEAGRQHVPLHKLQEIATALGKLPGHFFPDAQGTSALPKDELRKLSKEERDWIVSLVTTPEEDQNAN